MKILVLNWQDIKNPLGGGAEVHLHEIFSRIAKRGHQVTLFCSSFAESSAEEMIDGIRVVRRGSRNTFNFYVPWVYLFSLRSQHFDVVVDDINKIPFYSPLFIQRPLLAIVHHFFGKSIFREVSFIPALYVYVSEKLVRPIYRRTPFAVVSESTRREMMAKGFSPEKIAVVQNCVDHRVYRKTGVAKSPTPLVGFVGRLKRYKSIDHLLHAFAKVRREITNVKLVIVGDGDDRARLERLTRDLNLEDAVRFTGYISTGEKVRLLEEMWFVVNTSSKEGWGLTVIEANACGTPCLASDVPGLRDSVIDGQTGLLYEYGNLSQLADAMIHLIRNTELRGRLVSGALEWARKFDWNVEAEKMLGLLENIAASTTPAQPASPAGRRSGGSFWRAGRQE